MHHRAFVATSTSVAVVGLTGTHRIPSRGDFVHCPQAMQLPFCDAKSDLREFTTRLADQKVFRCDQAIDLISASK